MTIPLIIQAAAIGLFSNDPHHLAHGARYVIVCVCVCIRSSMQTYFMCLGRGGQNHPLPQAYRPSLTGRRPGDMFVGHLHKQSYSFYHWFVSLSL